MAGNDVNHHDEKDPIQTIIHCFDHVKTLLIKLSHKQVATKKPLASLGQPGTRNLALILLGAFGSLFMT